MTTTIGSQTNVPDPGSPITSPWAQDTARKLVHTFPNAAARDAWATAPDGAVAYLQDTNQLFVRRDTTWTLIMESVSGDARYVNADGDTMTGQLQYGDVLTTTGWTLRTSAQFVSHMRGPAAALLDANIGLTRNVSPAADVGGRYINFERGGASIGSVNIGTGGTQVVYLTTSDERLKTVVADDVGRSVTGGPQAVVDAVAVHQLEWLEAPGEPFYGFLAHEVQAEIPDAVYGERGAVDDDGNPIYQQVDRSALVAVLWAAVQQLAGRVAALEGAAG